MNKGWKTRCKIAVLRYFSSLSLTGKGAWLQHGWGIYYKYNFLKHTAKANAQISPSQTSLGPRRGEDALMHHDSNGTRAP